MMSPQIGSTAACLLVRAVDALYEEVPANNTHTTEKPTNHTYDIRENYVRDLDGHLICFGSDIDEAVH